MAIQVSPCPACGQRIKAVTVRGTARSMDVDGLGRTLRAHLCVPQSGASVPISDDDDADGAMTAADVYARLAADEEADEEKERQRRINDTANQHHVVSRTYDASQRQGQALGAVPAIDPDYLIGRDMFGAIARVIKLADSTGEPQNIGLHGEPGSGKTTLGIQIGAIRRAPTFVIDAGAKATADEWYGETTGIDRSDESGKALIMAEPSDFVRAIETPGAVVVINDVANMQSRKAQNGLNELLDPSTRSVYVPTLKRAVTVAAGVIIVGTWNVGTVSSSEISEQIISRFGAGMLARVPLAHNGELVRILMARTGISELSAERLSVSASWLRGADDPITVETRDLIGAATAVVNGATIGHALAYTVLGQLDADEQTRAFAIIDVQLQGATPEIQREYATPKTGDTDNLALLAQSAGIGKEE